MTTPTEKEEVIEEIDDGSTVLGMSDEDILNMPEPDTIQNVEDSSKIKEEPEEEVVEPVEDAPNEANTEETTTSDVTANDDEDNPEEATSDTSKELDYKAEYERMLAPFKANGKEMQVGSSDDVIRLMQQGANYSKKMEGLKPNLRLMKMLQKNELLDEGKLSYLIDLQNKNPEAIQKFIKDSGIDPLDIDTEKDTEYTPNTYTVDDKEVELDAVLDEIKDTQSFDETIDIISNKFDQSSKEVLLKEPAIIPVLNEHIGNGIYQKITGVIETERMLGRLQGLSDLDAYRTVGNAIQAAGGFNSQATEPTNTTPERVSNGDPKLKDKKRAASPTKVVANKKISADFNPLSMSDEEFEKMTSNQFM